MPDASSGLADVATSIAMDKEGAWRTFLEEEAPETASVLAATGITLFDRLMVSQPGFA